MTHATKRCGECRLGLGVHTPTDPYCTHHQTPATDSERDERPIYDAVMDAYEAHRRAGQEMHSALLDIWRMADPEGRKHLTYRDPSDVVMSVRALLAEQAATIERQDSLVRDLHRMDNGGSCLGCGTNEWGHPIAAWPCETIRALGSQRTEGQG